MNEHIVMEISGVCFYNIQNSLL